MKRRIAVATGSRAEYGLLYWILHDLREAADVELQLLVTGAHLSERYGHTLDEILRDGFRPAAEIPILEDADDSVAVARSIGRGIAGFGEAFARLGSQVLLLMADRYETFAAAAAAAVTGVPIAHLSGGESTEGLFDEQLRHAITKLSHLHFTSMEAYRERLIRMGESPDRVFTTGEPGLDHVRRTALLSCEEASAAVGLDLSRPTAVVTFHPVTLELAHTTRYVDALLAALAQLSPLQLLMSYPGADPSSNVIVSAFERFAQRRPGVALFKNLGFRRYLSALRWAGVMIGNSSSGLVEAPSFGLPAVNVGSRQKGRVRAANVIDVDADEAAIVAGVRQALSPAFRASLSGLRNPYGDGEASRRVVSVLREVDLASLRYKPFHDAVRA